MPFTLAHPAAAVPLRSVLGRRAVLSALVIGSMAPDFWYLVPFALTRSDTHSLGALFWFCLPAGLLVYFLYHKLMKQPWIELLPRALAVRLAGRADARLPDASSLVVMANLLAGSLTHLAWDAITHDGVPVERVFPALDAALFTIGTYQAYGYSLLQHLSTLAGLALLAIWIGAWFRHARPACAAPPRFSRAAGLAVLCAIAVPVGWIALSALAVVWQQRPSLAETRDLAKAALGQAGGVALLGLFVYGIAWHAALPRPPGAQR